MVRIKKIHVTNVLKYANMLSNAFHEVHNKTDIISELLLNFTYEISPTRLLLWFSLLIWQRGSTFLLLYRHSGLRLFPWYSRDAIGFCNEYEINTMQKWHSLFSTYWKKCVLNFLPLSYLLVSFLLSLGSSPCCAALLLSPFCSLGFSSIHLLSPVLFVTDSLRHAYANSLSYFFIHSFIYLHFLHPVSIPTRFSRYCASLLIADIRISRSGVACPAEDEPQSRLYPSCMREWRNFVKL